MNRDEKTLRELREFSLITKALNRIRVRSQNSPKNNFRIRAHSFSFVFKLIRVNSRNSRKTVASQFPFAPFKSVFVFIRVH